MSTKTNNVRLGNEVIPINYSITLAPNFKDFSFWGKEEISVNVKKPTKEITLHSVDLLLSKVKLKFNSQSFAPKIQFNKKEETVTLEFNQLLPKGEHILSLDFSGKLQDNMRGFYKSSYEEKGKKEHIAVTQFESTDARRAFPCFDEPSLKATFEISLVAPKDMIAISNTIEEKVEDVADSKKFTFAKSPKMSTYLLAFIVGKFERIEKETKEGVRVRVFVTKGKKKLAQFALDTAVRSLSFYTDYFSIPYPLPVLDMVAIPDFAAGAMENWGAVTYRETAILVSEKNSSTENRQRVALVICHELAHMWFGNLVTMEWWTDLWLNEGFASYMEFVCLDSLFPKWNMWTQFVYIEHARALELDSLQHTHPIEVAVSHPNEISEIFDAVSYSKGSSVIRMLAEYLGEEDFKKGLRQYLKKHTYQNAKTGDLWKSLGASSKKPVESIMQGWTKKAGYPFIKASLIGDKLNLVQSRFYLSPLSKKQSNDKTIWSIPLNGHLFNTKKGTIKVDRTSLKLNSNETAFVRIAYDKRLLNRLQKYIQNEELTPADRFGIVRDAFALSIAGEAETTVALGLVKHYKNEDEFIVWAEIINQLATIKNIVSREDFEDRFHAFSREILQNVYAALGWDEDKNESYSYTLLRPIVLYAMGSHKDAEAIKKAQQLFTAIRRGKHIDSDLRAVVYNLVAKNGTEAEYKIIKGMYAKEALQEEKDRLLKALCLFPQANLLKKTLEFSMSKGVRSQDAYRVVGSIFGNPEGREVAWKFLSQNWKEIVKRFGGGHLFPRFIQPLGFLVTEEDAKKVEAFFKSNSAPGGARTIQQALEQIHINALWRKRDLKALSEYF